jgi:hypothetical protein
MEHLRAMKSLMQSPGILTRCLAVSTLVMGGISVASATESGWYYGLNFGASNYSNTLTDAASQAEADDESDGQSFGSVDDSGTTWSFAMGYRINPYIGLEVAYVDLGAQSFRATGDPIEALNSLGYDTTGLMEGDLTLDIDGEIHSSGALIDVFGTFPVSEFEFSARAGIFLAKTKFKSPLTFRTTAEPIETETLAAEKVASTSELMFGLGAGYTFFDHLQIRVDYSFYKKVGEEKTTLETDISTLTAGVAYRF